MNSVLTGEAKHTAPALDTHDFIPNNLAAQTSLQWGGQGVGGGCGIETERVEVQRPKRQLSP